MPSSRALGVAVFALFVAVGAYAQDQRGVFIGRDANNSTINNNYYQGISSEELKAIITDSADRSEAQKKLVVLLEEKLRLRDTQILFALKRIQSSDIPSEMYGEKLVEFANGYVQLRAELDRLTGRYPALQYLRSQTEDAIESGSLQAARKSLREAQGLLVEGGREAAELAGIEALTASLDFDYSEASSLYLAASILSSREPAISLKFRLDYAVQLMRSGAESRRQDIGRAIRELEKIKVYPKFTDLEFAEKVDLEYGTALAAAADYSRDLALSDKAQQVLSGVTDKFTVGSSDWLHGMVSLGASYISVGKNSEAIKAYEKILAVSRNDVKKDNPTVFSNLGVAYAALGEKNNDITAKDKSFNYFSKAVEVDSGQSEYTRGQTRYNLGIATFNKAAAIDDVPSLKRAAELFLESINLLKETKFSQSWAHSQTNLGMTYLKIGRLSRDPDYFRKAISAFDAANLVWQPGDANERWLEATFYSVDAYMELAQREGERKNLDKIIEILSFALPNIDHDNSSKELLVGYMKMADARLLLWERFNDNASRTEAKLFYSRSRRLLAERVRSELLTVQQAYPQAVLIQSGLDRSEAPRRGNRVKK